MSSAAAAPELAEPAPLAIPRGGTAGAIVIGGDYRALGAVRSLGRRGIPVWVVRHGDDRLSGASRYARRTLELPEGPAHEQVAFLLGLPGVEGWTIFPSSDETAGLVARHHAELSERYRLTTPPWHVVRWAYDKRLTHRLGEESGVEPPRTWYPRGRADIESLACEFPVILKPAIKEGFNRLTAAKAWRVDSREELLARYDDACTLIDPELLMVQELVAGGGEGQLSYAALCDDGRILSSLVARRTRQFPMDFGRASTFVESIDDDEVAANGERLLAFVGYTGLVEVEFKRDLRDGRLKLLDINPRVWGWHTLCGRAGVDFAYLAWRLANGEAVPTTRARSGVRWSRLSTDLPTVIRELRGRRMSVRDYLRSLRGPRERAIFAWDDPLPGLIEGPLLAALVVKRLARGSGL